MGLSVQTCLITGVTGQDGAYLSQLLLEKGCRVIGLMRRSASSDIIGERLRWLGIIDRVELVDADMMDLSSLIRIVQTCKPDHVYNLAAQSFVAASWNQPILKLHVQPSRLRAADIAVACGNAGKAREILGWQPAIPWTQTLHDVFDDWLVRSRAEP